MFKIPHIQIPRICRLRCSPTLLAGLFAITLVPSSPSQPTNWTGTTGTTGSWFNEGNWDNGVPQDSYAAMIQNNGTAQIDSDGAVADSLRIGYNTAGFLEVLTNGTLNVHSLSVGRSSTGSVLRIAGGSVTVATGSIVFGWNAPDDASLIISNNGYLSLPILHLGLDGTGTLRIGEGGAPGTLSASRITSGATGFVIFNHNALSYELSTLIRDTVTVIHEGPGVTTLSGANTYTGGTELNAGTLSITSNSNLGRASGHLTFNGGTLRTTASFTMNRPTELQEGGGTFNIFTGNLTQNGVISGEGLLTKTGDGTLILTAANSYNGGTRIETGTLIVDADNRLGATGTPVELAGGELQVTAGFSTGRPILLNASGDINVNTAGTLELTGVLSGGEGLSKWGPGTLTLTGNNTYLGSTAIHEGTLSVSANHNLGNPGFGVMVSSLATLETTAGFSTSRDIEVTSGGSIRVTNGTLELSGTLEGNIGGDGITKTGTGTLAISSDNLGDLEGEFNLQEGTLELSNNNALGSATLNFNGGTLSANDNRVINNPITIGGNVAIFSGAGMSTLQLNGSINLGNAARTLNIEGEVNFAGAILGSEESELSLTTPSTALVLISGADDNNFASLRVGSDVALTLAKDAGTVGIAGDLRIDANGELDVSANGPISPIAPGANVRLDGRLDFEGTNTLDVVLASLTGSGELCNDGNPSALNLTIQSGSFSGQIHDRDEADSGGPLTLIKDGNGVLTLSGVNNYSGPTLVNGGTLIAASDAALSNTDVTVDGDTSLLRVIENVTLGNSLVLNNGGTLEAFGTLNGAITSGDGIVLVRNGGRINGTINVIGDTEITLSDGGRIAGDIDFGSHDSTLQLTGSGNVQLGDALSGDISGNYTLLKSGSGQWSIDRKLTPESTTIAEGTLALTGKGDLSGDILNEGTFIFGKRDGDYTFAGQISGSGSVLHESEGNTTILGEQTYTGTTSVNNGGLILGDGKVESSLAGNVIVKKGAFFGGSGSIGGDLTMAGILSPGYSPGSLAVRGRFTLQSTALLVIEIDSASDYDRISVGGKAKLGGILRIVLGDGFMPESGQRFDVLVAKSLSGKFSDAEGLDTWELVYGPNSLSFVFGAAAPREPYQSYAETPNQYNVAFALEKLRTQDFGTNTDFDNNVRPILDALAPVELRQAFEAITPNQSVAFSDTLFSRSRSWMPQMQTRLADIRAGSRGFVSQGFNQMGAANMKDVLAPVAENKWGVWVDGSGVFSQVAGFDGLRTGDASVASATVGVDYRLSDNFTAGFYTGYVGSWTDFGGNSEVDSNGSRFGIYSTYQSGGFYLNNLIGGEWNSYDWSRQIVFPGLNRTATAETQGTVFETMFGGGYDWTITNNFKLGLLSSLEYTLLFVDGFTESGAGALDLRVNDQNADSLRTNLGAQAMWTIPIGSRLLRPSLRAAWRHEYLDGSRRINSALAGGAGPGFSTLLPGGGRKNSLLVNAGFSMDLTDNISGYLYYTGDIAGGETENVQSVNAGLRMMF